MKIGSKINQDGNEKTNRIVALPYPMIFKVNLQKTFFEVGNNGQE